MINGKISYTQLFMFLFVSLLTDLITAPFLLSESVSLWSAFLPIIAQGVLFIIILSPTLLYSKTGEEERKFPKGLTAFVKLIYGVYFLYLTVMTSLDLADFSDDLSGSAVNKYIIVIAALTGAFYAAYQGTEAIMRFSFFIFAALILSSVLLVCFCYQVYDPIMLTPLSGDMKRDLLTDTISLLSLSPHLAAVFLLSRKVKGDPVRSALIWSLLSTVFIGGMFILICGSSEDYLKGMKYPLIHAIDASGTLQRFDPIYLGIAVSCVFCSLSFSLCIAKECFRPIAEKRRARKFLFPVAAVITGVISFVFSGNDSVRDILSFLATPLCIIFAFFIPLISLTVILVRRLNGKTLKFIKRATAMLLSVVICCIAFSGCGGLQLNKQSIIQGMAVDRDDEGYSLTCIVLDTKTEKSDNSVTIIRSEGKSFEQAVSALEAERGSKVMLSQCLFVLLDMESAERSSEITGYLSDNRQVMKSLNIMIAEGNAGELLENAVAKLGYDSETINMLTASNAVSTHTVRCSLFDYLAQSKKSIGGCAVPIVRTDTQTSSIITEGSAVLDKEGRIMALLDNNETLAIMVLKNSGNSCYFEYGEEVFRLTNTDASLKPDLDNDSPGLDISLTFHCDAKGEKLDMFKAFLIEDISRVIEKTVKRGADILSLCQISPSVQKKSGEELSQILKDLQYSIHINEY